MTHLPLKKTINRLVILVIMLFVCIGAYIGMTVIIKQDTEKVQLLESELLTRAQQKQWSASLQTLIDDSQEDRIKLNSYILSDDSVVGFVSDIEGIASTTNVVLEINSLGIAQVTSLAKVAEERFETLQMQIQIRGSWRNIIHFITLLENLPRHHYFSDMRLEYNDGRWKAFISLRALKFKGV